MYKYIYTIAKILQDDFDVDRIIDQEDKISELFDDPFDEIAWVLTLTRLELIYGFEIPDQLFDETGMALEEFADELSKLPMISDELYPEFFDIKFTSMKLTKRWIELEEKTDEDSRRELKEINAEFEELTTRLNMLLENNKVQELLVN